MKLTLIKTLSGLKPAHNSDYELYKKLKLNEEYQCEVKQVRNIRFHRKFFALLNMLYDNQEIYTNLDSLRKDLTIAAGYYDERVNFSGEVIIEAKSISFAKMSQQEFDELYNRVLDVIVKYFNFDREDIKNHIEQYF